MRFTTDTSSLSSSTGYPRIVLILLTISCLGQDGWLFRCAGRLIFPGQSGLTPGHPSRSR